MRYATLSGTTRGGRAGRRNILPDTPVAGRRDDRVGSETRARHTATGPLSAGRDDRDATLRRNGNYTRDDIITETGISYPTRARPEAQCRGPRTRGGRTV